MRPACASFRGVKGLLAAVLVAPFAGLAEPTHGTAEDKLIAYRYAPVVGCPVVIDQHTRLMWQRCSLGQVWDGTTCTGRPTRLEWDAANSHRDGNCGYDDWHLPEVTELEALVVENGIPAIDAAAFPNTPPGSFWTASVSTASTQRAWLVNFGRGMAQQVAKDARFHVRLVRQVP